MTFQGRSLDDLPLAAYTTGVAPDQDDSFDELADEAPAAPALTQQDLAAALAESTAAVNEPAAKPKGRSFSLKLPQLRRPRAPKLAQAAPFQPVAGAMAGSSTFQAVSQPMERMPTYHAVAAPMEPTRPLPPMQRHVEGQAGSPKPARPRVRMPRVTVPRLQRRDPRVLAGGAVAIGLVLLGVSLLGGRGPASGGAGPGSSQDAAAHSLAPVLGNASVELGGGMTGMYSLTSATGAGPAVDSHVDATWTDPLGQSLGLVGLASQGTRTTAADFSLSWTMLIDNLPVTFTSRDSECTVGMAVGVTTVHGTFVCKKLRSGDGKHVIDLRGEYTT